VKQFFGKLRASWLISLMVACLAAYTIIDYRNAQDDGTFAEDERASFSFRNQDIDYLLIERSVDPVELHRREDGQWHMTQPLVDDVEETSALSFLLSLTSQRVRLFEPEGEKQVDVDWAKFGLAPPAVKFVAGSKGKKEDLSFGTINAFDGSFYLRQKDELLIGDTGFAQLNARSSKSFRSRAVWREKGPVEKAEVVRDNITYTIAKKDGQWQIEPKPDFQVDTAKIEAWIERVQEFKPADIVKDELTEEDKRSYLLLVPSAKIQLNDSWQLIIGQNRAQDVFLYTNRKSTVFKVSSQGVSEIRVGPEFFRDGRKAFDFPVELARSIEIRDGKISVVLKKTDAGWANGKGADVSAAAVSFMQTLKGLEGLEFGGPPKTGIASPQILVKDKDGKDLFTFAWGTEYKARADYNDGAILKYARTNLEQEVLGISKEKLEYLMRALEPKEPAGNQGHHNHGHDHHHPEHK
jgi:hypothetical protein